MAILIEAGPDAAQTWKKVLRSHESNLDIRIYPELGDPQQITSLLSWKPPSGLLPRLTSLRLLQCSGAGVDQLLGHPDLHTGIQVARLVDSGQARDLATYVLGAAVAWYRRLDIYAAQQALYEWRRIFPHPRSADCKVGVMGMGMMGQTIANAFMACGFPVSGWSGTGKALNGVETFSGRSKLLAFAQKCNILVCALPLTPETRGILNDELFQVLASPGLVVNVGRGEHIVESDLLAWLERDQLASAALDVHKEEPLPSSHPFWKHLRIRVTPHIGAFADPQNVAWQVIENHRRVLAGAPPVNLIDFHRGY